MANPDQDDPAKPLVWIGRSLADLKDFPVDVRSDMGHALFLTQLGLKPHSAKPLTGFHGAGVLEIVEDFDGDTYRAVYTVRLSGRIYVLHAFQKKSKRGAATPKPDMDLVKIRLKRAEAVHAEWLATRKETNS